jgi:hypothetical protein
MSYEIVITYTKTAETPADAFKMMPVLKPAGDVTQEQITALNAAYPVEWDTRVVQDQVVIHNIFRSKEDHAARNADPIIKNLQAKREEWATANHITVDIRVL